MSSRPRIRTLKPEMWQDEKIGALSRDARLLFVGLVTLSDDEGRFRALPQSIIGHIYPWDNRLSPRGLEAWMSELEEAGLMCRYRDGAYEYGYLPGWPKHQKINRPSPSELPAPSLNGSRRAS